MEENNKFELKPFLLGFFITLIPYVIMFFVFNLYEGYGIIGAFFLALLFMIIGIVLWLIIRFGFKKRFLGLGFLIGGLSPLLVMFIFTGGCGMFI